MFHRVDSSGQPSMARGRATPVTRDRRARAMLARNRFEDEEAKRWEAGAAGRQGGVRNSGKLPGCEWLDARDIVAPVRRGHYDARGRISSTNPRCALRHDRGGLLWYGPCKSRPLPRVRPPSHPVPMARRRPCGRCRWQPGGNRCSHAFRAGHRLRHLRCWQPDHRRAQRRRWQHRGAGRKYADLRRRWQRDLRWRDRWLKCGGRR